MDIYKRLEELNLTLPQIPAKGGAYKPCNITSEKLCFLSGCGPNLVGGPVSEGRLGETFSIEEGQSLAKNAVLNLLTVLNQQIKDLNRVKNVVKILVFVSCSETFYSQPQVADGASQLLIDIFGEEKGTPARTAFGVHALPGNIPIEIEAIFEIQ